MFSLNQYKLKDMKRLFLVLSILLSVTIVMPAFSQTEKTLSKKEQKKLEKQRKKEAEKQKEIMEFNKVKKLVEDSSFVFIATRLYGPNGRVFNLNQTLNFLAVNKKKATYQMSFHGIVGWNGLGGVTFDGHIVKYKVKFAKKPNKSSYLDMLFVPDGIGGITNVSLTFFGTYGTVTLNFDNGTNIRLDGRIKSIEEAGIIKGKSIF